MQIDDEWSVHESRGFTWWGHHLAQRVWAEPTRLVDGVEVTEVHAETDLLRHVADDAMTAETVSELNRLASLSALVWDRQNATVSLACKMYTHAGIAEWVHPMFVQAVVLQAATAGRAEWTWPMFADSAGSSLDTDTRLSIAAQAMRSEPAVSMHPRSGIRDEPDGNLSAIADVFMIEGLRVSPFDEDDFGPLLRAIEHPWLSAEPDGVGIWAILPYYQTDSEKLLAKRRGQPETAGLGMWGDVDHPMLGSGLSIHLVLPSPVKHAQGADLASALNAAERSSWTRVHLLGAWLHDPDADTLQYVCFMPTVLYGRLLVDVFALYMAERARWARVYLSDFGV